MRDAITVKGLPAQLVTYLRQVGWTSKGDLTTLEWRHVIGKSVGAKYLPETVGRALRLLEEDSIIAVKPCGISVQYRYLPPEKRAGYIPTSARAKGEENVLFKQ